MKERHRRIKIATTMAVNLKGDARKLPKQDFARGPVRLDMAEEKSLHMSPLLPRVRTQHHHYKGSTGSPGEQLSLSTICSAGPGTLQASQFALESRITRIMWPRMSAGDRHTM
jgi:hypothetical protein